jgi:hypothetical protein
MADDTFNMSPDAIQAIDTGIQSVNKQLNTTNQASDTFAQSLTSINSIVSTLDANTATMYNTFASITTEMRNMSNIMSTLHEVSKDIVKAISDQKDNVSQVVSEIKKEANTLKQISTENEKHKKQQTDEIKNNKLIVAALKQEFNSFRNYASIVTGVTLSLGAALALLVEATNQTRKISGLSTLINTQYAQGGKSLHSTNSAIFSIHKNFKMAVEEVGSYITQIGRAGLKKEEVNKYAQELIANEKIYGEGIDSQVESINNLVGNYNMVTNEALNYASLVREVAKLTPDMSLAEITKDLKEMNSEQLMYNSNLFGTIGLFNVLMRKDIGKKLGLDKLPKEFKLGLLQGVTGAQSKLSYEWKAALGMSMGKGKTPSEAISGFEKIKNPAEILKGVVDFAKKSAGGSGTDQKLITRMIIDEIGVFSKDVTKKLMDSIDSGELNSENLAKIVKESTEEESANAAKAEKQGKTRDNNISATASALTQMQPVQDKIHQWLVDTLGALVPKLLHVLSIIRDYVVKAVDFWMKKLGFMEEKKTPQGELSRIGNTLLTTAPTEIDLSQQTVGIAAKQLSKNNKITGTDIKDILTDAQQESAEIRDLVANATKQDIQQFGTENIKELIKYMIGRISYSATKTPSDERKQYLENGLKEIITSSVDSNIRLDNLINLYKASKYSSLALRSVEDNIARKEQNAESSIFDKSTGPSKEGRR